MSNQSISVDWTANINSNQNTSFRQLFQPKCYHETRGSRITGWVMKNNSFYQSHLLQISIGHFDNYSSQIKCYHEGKQDDRLQDDEHARKQKHLLPFSKYNYTILINRRILSENRLNKANRAFRTTYRIRNYWAHHIRYPLKSKID